VVEGNSGETVSGGTTAAPLIGNILSKLLKDYKPPEKTKEEEPKEEPPDEEAAPAAAEESTEFTEDLMNPQGAPVPEELSDGNGEATESAPAE
jgi:hypothetical protein